jgi:hypothetical protein
MGWRERLYAGERKRFPKDTSSRAVIRDPESASSAAAASGCARRSRG